jgi:iron-sulfur cluster assembly protein
VEEVRRLMALETEEDLFLRIGLSSGGCSGLSYSMTFDSQTAESDAEFDFSGVKVRVDQKALAYLSGTVIDYSGSLMGGGFQFSNPNATRSCGCGSSFSC